MKKIIKLNKTEPAMKINPEHIAPCGLYCGICGVYYATRDNNQNLIGANMAPKSGYMLKRHAMCALNVDINFSEEQKGAICAKPLLIWTDQEIELPKVLSIIFRDKCV
ncbi:MAG: DUF3795 domain-containing protein [Planctomycetota bacterium]